MEDDLYDNCVALFRFNGTDGSTTITQETGSPTVYIQPMTWTCYGNAQLNTANAKYGSACLKLDGTGDWVKASSYTSFNLSDKEFTFDGWVKFNTLPASGYTNYIISRWNSGATRTWIVGFRNNSGTYELRWTHTSDGTSGTTVAFSSSGLTVSTGTWYHFAIERFGNTMYMFWGGVLVGTHDMTGMIVYSDFTNVVTIGASDDGAAPSCLDGYIDDLRFYRFASSSYRGAKYRGVAFTAPTAEAPTVSAGSPIRKDPRLAHNGPVIRNNMLLRQLLN